MFRVLRYACHDNVWSLAKSVKPWRPLTARPSSSVLSFVSNHPASEQQSSAVIRRTKGAYNLTVTSAFGDQWLEASPHCAVGHKPQLCFHAHAQVINHSCRRSAVTKECRSLQYLAISANTYSMLQVLADSELQYLEACQRRLTRPLKPASNWILMSCQPWRVTPGRPDTVIS